MGSGMDELHVMGRWQIQQSPQVTAAGAHMHPHSQKHTHPLLLALCAHTLAIRLFSYPEHCFCKPFVCVCVMPAFRTVGKRTNGCWGLRAKTVAYCMRNNENRHGRRTCGLQVVAALDTESEIWFMFFLIHQLLFLSFFSSAQPKYRISRPMFLPAKIPLRSQRSVRDTQNSKS